MTRSQPSNFINPGKYIVTIEHDGSMIWVPVSGGLLLQNYWLTNAPFSFDTWIDEMEILGKMNNNVWQGFQMRGGKKTSSFEVRGCYEALLGVGCLPVLSFPQIAAAFNEFHAAIKTPRILNCHCIDNYEFYFNVFTKTSGTPKFD